MINHQPYRKWVARILFLYFTWVTVAAAEEGPIPTSQYDEPSSYNTAEAELPPIFLNQGEQRLIRVSNLKKYSLGSTHIRVTRLPHEARAPDLTLLLLKGISAGSGDLWVWKGDGSSEHRLVKVEKLAPEEVTPPLERALGKLTETEIIFSGQGVILRGLVKSLSESARIRGLTQAFPKEIHDETELSSDLLARGENTLRNWLKTRHSDAKLRLEIIEKTLWVRGSVAGPVVQASTEKQIHSLFPAAQIDLQSLPDNAPTVHFKVFLLELKKSRFHTFGLSWPASVEGAFHITTAAIQDNLGLDVAIQALEGEGSVKILSAPELVVRAPGEAELFSGGEIPIHLESHYFSSVSWKPFGLTLKLKVSDTTEDQVRLEIFTEVSRLDPSLEPGSPVPSIQSNRIKTQVDARYGSPLLLSGLLQQGTREQARGLPFLRQIPILGSLFGSEDYLNENSELVAILLPSHTPPPAPLEKLKHYLPMGPIPEARNDVSPQEERKLRADSDFPWNALQTGRSGESK